MPDKLLMKGNEAIAEAAVRAGCRAYFGYPITPQTQIIEYLTKRLPEVGGVCLQAESEVAAINMVYGAAAAGARVMTSSSGPGFSLKAEGMSYLAACELPAVIVNVMRAGPGLGGILPSQSDYLQATKGAGHGDYHCIVLAPSSVQECMNLVVMAFDLADKYRNPVIILADGLLGQMMEPVVMSHEYQGHEETKPWATIGTKNRSYRNVINSLDTEPDSLEKHNVHLGQKFDLMKNSEVRYEIIGPTNPDILVAAYGTTARICRSAIDKAAQEGMKVSLFRPITLWPYPEDALRSASANVREVLVVEMNNGQMVEDVRRSVPDSIPISFYGRNGGNVPSVNKVYDQIVNLHAKGGVSCPK